MRTLFRSLGLGATILLAAVLAAPSAIGGGTSINASGTSFTPATLKVAQGTSVSWAFSGTHNTTSNQAFWASGNRSSGSYAETMKSAGRSTPCGQYSLNRPFEGRSVHTCTSRTGPIALSAIISASRRVASDA